MDDSNISQNIVLQLSEIDMLSSMYSNDGEFVLDDPSAVVVMQDYVDGKATLENVKSRISFVVNLEIGESKTPLEIVTHFPFEYPNKSPEIMLRSSSLNSKAAYKLLTEDMQCYIDSDTDEGELKMCYILQWLQENSEKYMIKSLEDEKQRTKTQNKKSSETVFSRMWIYSHHIYSKIKRKDILEFSSELNLTGFSMPGKPGIIAIEGYNSDVEEFWHRIRRMQWKRLVMKEKEDFKVDSKDIDSLRKFEGFEEKCFEARQHSHSKGRNYHGDRGLLYKFLEQRDCAHVFQYYFGVEGKPTEADSDSDD